MKEHDSLEVYAHWLAFRFSGRPTEAFFSSIDTLIIHLDSPPYWLLEISASERDGVFELSTQVENAFSPHEKPDFILRATCLAYQLGILSLNAAESVIAAKLVDDEYGAPQSSDTEIDSAFNAYHGHHARIDHDEYRRVLHHRLSTIDPFKTDEAQA